MAAKNSMSWKSGALVVVTIGLLAVGVWGYLQGEVPPGDSRFYLRSSAGAVVFTHRGHQKHVRDCVHCHHELGPGLEAVNCRICHPGDAPDSPAFLGCLDCHDDPDYGPETLEHTELLEIHENECDSCHNPRCVADAYHLQCSRCHLDLAPERFFAGDGQVECAACHLK